MKEKIIQITNNFISFVKPKLLMLDTKINNFVPNPKTKKILYITVGSLFGFIFLIIILGIIISPFRNIDRSSGIILKKPQIETFSPAPQKELSETQKKILGLEIKIKEMRFPESTLNIPVLESEIKI
ncbi:MAG: hypothetical protein Q8M92_09645 [Candidatus Subteraquimicrobiales bacterium]|nr:hypothetical protein [Candidatus Subteraquimicrobiales bacterium]